MRHGSKKTKVKSIKKSVVGQEGEFQLGHFYRTIEEHIEAFAVQDGSPYSFADVALRIADALRFKATEVRESLRSAKLLHEMRKVSTPVGLQGPGLQFEEVHVASRGGGALKPKRELSKKARKAIGRAQRARWKKYHQAQKLQVKKAA